MAVFVYTTFIPFTPPAPQANESARMTPCSLGSRPYETRQDKLRHGKEERQDPVEKNTKPWSLSSLLEHKKEKDTRRDERKYRAEQLDTEVWKETQLSKNCFMPKYTEINDHNGSVATCPRYGHQ